jgi:hypothetical protein
MPSALATVKVLTNADSEGVVIREEEEEKGKGSRAEEGWERVCNSRTTVAMLAHVHATR